MKFTGTLLLAAVCCGNAFGTPAGDKYEVINFLLKNVNNKYNQNYKLYLCSKAQPLITEPQDSLNIVAQLEAVGVQGKELELRGAAAPAMPFLAATDIRQRAVVTDAYRFEGNKKTVYTKNGQQVVRNMAAPKVRYYSFSDPLFFKKGTMCVVLHAYASGATSGGHCHYLLQRKGSGWKVVNVFDCKSY